MVVETAIRWRSLTGKNVVILRNIDRGLTHIALPVSDVDRSIEFYSKYAGMQVVHGRIDAESGVAVGKAF